MSDWWESTAYHVSPKFSVKAGIDHQVYAETRGSTLIRHAPSGQASRTTMSTLAVAYQF